MVVIGGLTVIGELTVQVFRYQIPGEPGDVVWNVTAALAAVARGEIVATVTMDPAALRDLCRRNTWDPHHIDEVDPSIPGIGAPLVFDPATHVCPEGSAPGKGIYYVTIDGLHRAARCLRDELPFKVQLLTDAAAKACLISGPAHLLPWTYQVATP